MAARTNITSRVMTASGVIPDLTGLARLHLITGTASAGGVLQLYGGEDPASAKLLHEIPIGAGPINIGPGCDAAWRLTNAQVDRPEGFHVEFDGGLAGTIGLNFI